jgi:hypothetical protein
MSALNFNKNLMIKLLTLKHIKKIKKMSQQPSPFTAQLYSLNEEKFNTPVELPAIHHLYDLKKTCLTTKKISRRESLFTPL